MSIDRELIYGRIFERLETIEGLKEVSRKLRHWSDVVEFPVVFLAQGNENVTKSGRGLNSVNSISPTIYAYVKVEIDQLPGPTLNRILDAITLSLEPTMGTGNKQTLGGIVEDCYINGQILTDEGTLGQLAVAIIPLNVVVSQ